MELFNKIKELVKSIEFFYKLFPYKSIYNWDDETLTAFWVVAILIIFFGFLFYLYYTTWNKRISKSLRDFPNFKKISGKIIETIWNDYQSTFIEYNGNSKTYETASDYFNIYNLISKRGNFRLLNSIPSILVGFGILGTFVGLTFGISNFKTGSTEEIKDSISILLAGMGTAFVSSIWGMSLSLIFTYLEKRRINKLQSKIHKFCYKVDKQFKITKKEEREIQLLQQEEVFINTFYFKDEHNNLIKPSNIFRDIYEEARKQSQALQSFSTDLATKIDAGFESLLTNNQEGVIPELRLLKTGIENLGKKLEDPTTEMTQNIVKDLELSMKQMIEEFKISVSGTTKSEFENLTSLLKNAGDILEEFPPKMKEMSEIFSSKITELQIGQEMLLNKQNESIEVSDKLLNTFNYSIDKMNNLSIEITETISEFESVKSELVNASSELFNISKTVNSSSEIFRNAQDGFINQSNKFLENNSKTLQELQLSLNKAQEVSTDYSQKFNIIQNGLKGIFEQIQEGLMDYKKTIEENLKSYLGEYTNSLTKTADSLASAAKEQENILDELTEQLSKLTELKIQ